MKRKFTLFLIVCFAMTGWNTTAGAQCTLDQNQPTNNGGTSERNLPGYFDWQSFTAGISGALCEVDVLYCNTNVHLVGSGILKIYDGTGIGGTLLSTDTVMVDGSATAFNIPFWQDFTLAAPPSVVLGQVYTWEFIPIQGGGLTDPYLIQINIPDVYAGGVSYNFGTGGDIAFATHVDATLGINNHLLQNAFVVYPNPASDVITLKGNLAFTNENYAINDQLGRVVLTGKLNGASTGIDISELSPGIYFLKIEGENQVTIKIVKE